jgi:hypothetical protein
VEGKFLFDSLLERLAFLEGKRISLGNDRNHIDYIGQFL